MPVGVSTLWMTALHTSCNLTKEVALFQEAVEASTSTSVTVNFEAAAMRKLHE